MRTTFRPIVLASVLALTATGLVTGPAAAAPVVPADCGVWTTAYQSSGQRVSYGYSNQQTAVESYPGDTLPWVPTAQQQLGAAGDTDLFISTELVTHPTDGYLYLLERRGERTNGIWKMTRNEATRLASGFANTRVLAYGYPYMYRVAGTSLYRYEVKYTNGAYTVSAPTQLASTNWNTVNTFTYERTEGAVDILIGTKTNGELKEWRINRTTPTSIASTVLKTTGFAAFGSLSSGWCQDHPTARPLLAITPAGAASAYFDANATDRNGTDITGESLGALGWTGKAYGQ
ncbi:hypothetical protein HPO96_25700 [Kribbella sandramycini]|uniref:Uncharacterized protein n=1 Tax=Kribbella sandramycini TaxID=60450 RepID=A0A7Y4L5B6_9ACTN|nr:hypothetical protein [Kribbella sandramycini]MBB6570500.1 hypothetical protein [Kribbella sandramycini]NOL43646.1 hypothetical protein [Kribbella sandramycini]